MKAGVEASRGNRPAVFRADLVLCPLLRVAGVLEAVPGKMHLRRRLPPQAGFTARGRAGVIPCEGPAGPETFSAGLHCSMFSC